jgi:hypothetical protein
MSPIRTGVALVAPLFALTLLAGCNSNDNRSPFENPGVTPTPSASPSPSPAPVTFQGDSAAFVEFVRNADPNGDPLPVNDGAVVFEDTSDVTDPAIVNVNP